MGLIRRILNSFVFWGGWIIIPVLMEIIPSIGSVIVLVKRRIRNRINNKKPAFYPEVSVIVPVYNSQDTLFACIASIYHSTYPTESIRVFLVNNEGQDDSFSVYAECQKQFPDLKIQWLNAEQGKSRALNLALYNSEGKYIINLDSDGVLEPSALENLVTKFENNTDLNCMTGAILTMPEKIREYKGVFPRLLRNLEFMEYAQAFLAGRAYASEMNAIYTLSGAFSAFRKSAVLKSWMYNTDTICEDTHITFQMRYLQNERVEICEDAIFFVDPIEDMDKLYTQRQRWQRGSLEVARMFMDKDFRVHKLFTNISVKTLLYDHTFAFPRMIWYLALLCLMFKGYSATVIMYSTAIIFGMYILIGYFYFITVVIFLHRSPKIRRYYLAHWWCVALLPAFNFIVFFIRMAGIINSIQTDSTWKTRTLTEEWGAFMQVIRKDLSHPIRWINRFRNVINVNEEEDDYLEVVELPESPSHSESKATFTGRVSVIWYLSIGMLYLLAFGIVYVARFVAAGYVTGEYHIAEYITGKNIIPFILVALIVLLAGIIDYYISKKRSIVFTKRIHTIMALGSSMALTVAVLYINYQYEVLSLVQQWLSAGR